MNNKNKSKLILIFPFVSISVIIMHLWIVQKALDFNNSNNQIPSYLIINRSTIISILGHFLMLIVGFVLYGSIRDKDFNKDKLILTVYCIGFIILLLFSINNLYMSIINSFIIN